MAIVAEILLADRTLPFVDLARSLPNGKISIYSWLPLEDKRLLLTVRIDSSSREAFENGSDAQTEIDDAVEIGPTGGRWFYQLTIHDDFNLIASHDYDEFEGVLIDATITSEGLREQKVFSDFDAFRTLRDRCELHDNAFELLTIASDPENPGERDQFGLTDKQYRALSTAFTQGYYDSPRRLSTQELADEFGISAAAASDLLRRAEFQLISQTLGSKQYVAMSTE
ncbi:helix-turn-helix domain-containing protein [Halocatena marina]|uniref:Helix-turn-helix domain-containing protein n=1 Tax=Halocatena marina TaxID=2934937 RepID=A0ABD5YLF3_9EURY|nr:helix-turn-helix domain-containing protein [Halocatena marina]